MEVRLRPPPAHRSRKIADDTAAEDRCTAEFSARPLRRRHPGGGALLPVWIKSGKARNGRIMRASSPNADVGRRRRGSPAGHRVVVTVCRAPPVVSALMKVGSTVPQGVSAQALPLPGEYLVGWLSGLRIWKFTRGWVETPSFSMHSVSNSALPCPNARP